MKNVIVFLLLAMSLTAWSQGSGKQAYGKGCENIAACRQYKPTIAILGDSYSTFEGFIPKDYATWYTATPQERTDVKSVEQTWWWQVISKGGYKLGVNNSWSGATICNTGYNDEDYTDRSFVSRSTQLGTPDIILICGATNDHWANVKMGDYQYANWKRADLYLFRPAMAKMLDNISLHYPNTQVFFILNTELKKEINESVAV
ncbi:MAG: SGNH/GDSL hydrolase family protein, partial [Prevotella sp.]